MSLELAAQSRYVIDPIRLKFLDLIDLGGKQVLEIGCSLGQHTVEIARRAAHVSAIDRSPEQVEFVTKRCREADVRNVDVKAGGELPAPLSFGVLRRCVDEPCAGMVCRR
jgi:protein-L-isoaspartate O-methyltransferase